MKWKDSRIRRRRIITDEPMFIDPGLLGKPLASPSRRGAAYLADLVIVLLIVLSGTAAVNILRQPSLVKSFASYLLAEPGPGKEAAGRKLNTQFFGVVHERNPEVLPSEIRAAIEARDDSALAACVSSYEINVVMELDARESTFDEETGMLRLGSDVMTGFGGFATGVPFFIAYFTILTRAMRGRTPGKALAGIRVTRLDGRRLTLWDSFGRAGGYAASAATGFIGFLEVLWHPNRQAIHDRIVGTVVAREKRGDNGERGPSEGKAPAAKAGKGESP
ncbi:MAG: RDD family protein [Candidatus Krumholzibacteria bacterium]|nr:RDD family protein [Candidatus Krumholzibacteria bacterium]